MGDSEIEPGNKGVAREGIYGEYKPGQISKCSDNKGRKDMNEDSEERDDMSGDST